VADLFYFGTEFDSPFLFCSWKPERNSIRLLSEEIGLHCLLTEYAIRKGPENKEGLDLNGTHQHVVYEYDDNIHNIILLSSVPAKCRVRDEAP
jgi:hypothetical protein